MRYRAQRTRSRRAVSRAPCAFPETTHAALPRTRARDHSRPRRGARCDRGASPTKTGRKGCTCSVAHGHSFLVWYKAIIFGTGRFFLSSHTQGERLRGASRVFHLAAEAPLRTARPLARCHARGTPVYRATRLLLWFAYAVNAVAEGGDVSAVAAEAPLRTARPLAWRGAMATRFPDAPSVHGERGGVAPFGERHL